LAEVLEAAAAMSEAEEVLAALPPGNIMTYKME
jgi:hypothetical protein